MFKMKAYLFLWIFICGTLLLEPCISSSELTSTDSSFSNLVIDRSTEASFDNLLITSLHNFSDASSMNSVTTETSQSSLANEECNSTDCVKNVYTSSSSESLSPASKILWNLVSTSKSTPQPSVNEENNLSEESTVSSLYSPVTVHSSDLPSIHGTSFYSSDNELDSEINYDEVQPMHSDNKLSNLVVSKSDNFTTSSTESVIYTEIMDEIGELHKNISLFSTDNETQTDMVTDLYNISNAVNATTALPNREEATGYTDDEIDFTTYFINFSNSSDESIMIKPNTEINAHFHDENFTSEIPFIESDASAESNESDSLFSLDYNVTSDSKQPESKESVTVNPRTLDFHKSYSTNTESVKDNTEISTLLYLESDSSFEPEKLKSKNSLMNTGETEHTTHIPFDSPVNSDTNVELSNEAFTDIDSVSTESPTSDFQTNVFTDSLTQNSSYENGEIHNNEKDEIMNQSVTTDKSLLEENTFNNSNESTEGIDYVLNFNKDLNHTNILSGHTTMVKDFSEKSVGELFSQAISTTVASARSVDFEPSVSVSGTEGSSSAIPYLDNSTEGSFDKVSSSDLFDYNNLKQNTTLRQSTSSPGFENAEERQFTSENTDQNRNVEYLSTVHDTSYADFNDSDNFNEIHHDLPLVKTNNTFLDSKVLEMSSEISVTLNSSAITSFTETSIEEVTSKQILANSTEGQENNSLEIEEMRTDQTDNKVSTNEVSPENATEVFGQTPKVGVVSSEEDSEHKFSTTESAGKLMNDTDYMIPRSYTEKSDTKTVNDLGIVSSVFDSTVTPTYSTIRVVTETISDSKNAQTVVTEHTEKVIRPKDKEYTMRKEGSVTQKPATDEVESISKTFSENDAVTNSNYLFTSPISTSHDTEIETASEISTLSYTETHREGKHIPFSSTLGHRTTQYPRIFNVTARTYSHPPQPETTRHNFDDLLYSQIRAEELSPEERSNLINAVVKFPDRHYSKEELNERIAVIHLWLLHVVADEYKNTTLNLSGSNTDKLNDIEFDNLPQILYIFPTPEVFSPNVTFTFVVHNKWRNETFPADIILTILNLHSESLKKVLVDIEDIHFSHGLLLQKHDLLSVIIEKYGIILLSTCLITVGMILLLICIVIYYRRKTRHSAHCLTDDKLHRNMQEAMGIDLNPAVIILQEEIREKAALNGNKICSLDDDEGWLAPIGDVPVEDNNAPYVQDTKL